MRDDMVAWEKWRRRHGEKLFEADRGTRARRVDRTLDAIAHAITIHEREEHTPQPQVKLVLPKPACAHELRTTRGGRQTCDLCGAQRQWAKDDWGRWISVEEIARRTCAKPKSACREVCERIAAMGTKAYINNGDRIIWELPKLAREAVAAERRVKE